MAGLGYKDFTAGAVLTAAQVDGYLMEQAVMNFAGTAARGSALSSVQSAGMMAHVGGGTVTVYDGSAWQQVYPVSGAGLTFITSAALTGASVSINNCFSATYVNYRIIVARSDSSVGANPLLRLRASGTDANTNYGWQELQMISTTVSAVRSTSQTSFRYGSIDTTADNALQIIDISAPFIAANTALQCFSVNTAATPTMEFRFGFHATATSYDGITFFPSTGNWDTGTVSVFGYK